MFESLISGVLGKYLGDYIKNLDQTALNLSVWKGDLELRNLEFKENAFKEFKVPILVKQGCVGKLSLQIPWNNLTGEAIVVILEDVYVLVGPNSVVHYDEKAEKEHERQKKKAALKLIEYQLSPTEKQQSDSLFSALVTTIVDNIQVQFKRIHIRYQPDISECNDPPFDASPPVTIGITLDQFSIISTNSQFVPAFIMELHKIIYKRGSVGNFGIYCNTKDKPIQFQSNEHLKQTLEELLKEKDTNYIVKPISMDIKMVFNKSYIPNKQIPWLTMDVLLDQLTFALNEVQYKSVLALVDYFMALNQRWQNRMYRPTERATKNPRAWWKYAFQVVRQNLPSTKFKWASQQLLSRRTLRKEYVTLFKLKLKGLLDTHNVVRSRQNSFIRSPDNNNNNAMDLEEIQQKKARLQEIEDLIRVEEIAYYRQLATDELIAEGFDRRAMDAVKNAKKKQKQSWWSSWLYPGYYYYNRQMSIPAVVHSTLHAASPQHRTEEEFVDEAQKKFLKIFQMISDQGLFSGPPPPDFVQYKILLQVEQGSIRLHTPDNRNIGAIIFEQFMLGCKIFPKTISLGMSLRSFQVTDEITPKNNFPIIVTPFNMDCKATKPTKSTSNNNNNAISQFDIADSMDDNTENLFDLLIEYCPYDLPGVDFHIKMVNQPVQIVYNKSFIERLRNTFDFFTREEDEGYGKNFNATKSLSLSGSGHFSVPVDHSSKLKVQTNLPREAQKTLKLNVKLRAPQILFPENVSHPQGCMVAVADLGKLIIQSTDYFGPSDHTNSHHYAFYVRMTALNLNLTHVTCSSPKAIPRNPKILLRSSYTNLRDAAQNVVMDNVVKNFDLNFTVSLMAKHKHLPHIKITGTLPTLEVSLSSAILSHLTRIAMSVIIDAPTTSPTQQHESAPSSPPPVIDKERQKKVNLRKERLMCELKLEMTFTLNQLRVVVLSNNRTPDNNLLISLVLRNICTTIVQRTFDTRVESSLLSLILIDHLVTQKLGQNSPASYLATTYNDIQLTTRDAYSTDTTTYDPSLIPFIQLSYVFISKESPKYKDVDSLLQFKMENLNATLHRETALQILDFVQSIDITPQPATVPIQRVGSRVRIPQRSNSGNLLLLSPVKQLVVGERRSSVSSPSSPLSGAANLNGSFVTKTIDPSIFVKKVIKFQLVACCRSINVSLHENWSPLCQAGVDTFRLSFKQYNNATNTLKASIVNVTANQTPSSDILKAPQPILYSRPESGKQIPLLSLSYKFDTNQKSNNTQPCALLVKVNRVGYVYNSKFLDQMQAYFEPFTAAFSSSKPESKSKKSQTTLKYKVLIIQPEITIPMDWNKSRMGSIQAEFKDIFIYNGMEPYKEGEDEIERTYEKHSVLLNEMTVSAKLQADEYHQLTSNVSIMVEIRNNPKFYLMAVDIPDLTVDVTLEEYHLVVDLYKMLFQNSSPSNPTDYKDETKVLNRISVHFGKICWNLMTDQPIHPAPERQAKHQRGQSLTQSTDLRVLLDLSTGSELRYDKFHELRLELSGKDLVRSSIRNEINKGIGLSILSSKIDSLVVLYRLSGNLKVQLYRTEIQHDNMNPTWKAFRIPIHNIKHDETIIVECYDFASVTMNDLIGTFETNLTGLLHQTEFELINPKLKKKQKGYTNSGVIQILNAELLTASGMAEIPSPPTMSLEETRHKQRSRSRSLSLGLLKPETLFGVPVSDRTPPVTPRNPKLRTIFASLSFHETTIKYVKTHELSMLVDWTAELAKATNYHTHYDVKEFLKITDFQLHYNYNVSHGRGHGMNIKADSVNLTYVAHIYKHMKDFIFPGLYRFSQDENIEIPVDNNNNNKPSSQPKIPFQFRLGTQCEDFQIQMLVDPNNMSNVAPPAEANAPPVLTNASCIPLLARCRFTSKFDMIECSTHYSMLLDNFHILKWSSLQEPVSYESLFDSGPMIPAYDATNNKPTPSSRPLNESAESSATEATEMPDTENERQVVLYPITFQLKYWNDASKKDCGLSATATPAMQFVLSIQDYRVLLGFYYSLFDELPFRLYPNLVPESPPTPSDYDMAVNITAKDLSMVLVHESNEMPPLLFFDLQSLVIQGIWPRDVVVTFNLTASNYNMYKAAWEPFIEKWPLNFGYRFRTETTPSVCNLTQMTIEGVELLNINITNSFVYNAKAWMDDGTSNTSKNKNFKLFNALSIRNLNSRKIFFRLSNTKDKIEVQPQEKKVISTITKTKKREVDVLVDRKLSLYVELNYFKELPIIEEGITILPLNKSNVSNSQYLVYEVQFENGRRLITLRSTILINNKTQFPLEVNIRKIQSPRQLSPTVSPLRSSLKDDTLSPPEQRDTNYNLKPIPPGENGSVPLDYVNKGLLFFRPVVNSHIQANLTTSSQEVEFEWSDPLDCDLSNVKHPVYLSMQARNIPYTFYCCIGVTADKRFSAPLYTIDVCTPLLLENLLCGSLQFKLVTIPVEVTPSPGTLTPIGSSGSLSDSFSNMNSPNASPPSTPPSTSHPFPFRSMTPPERPSSQRPSLDSVRSLSQASVPTLKKDASRESLLQSITSFNRAYLKKSGRKDSQISLLPSHTVQGSLNMADTLHVYNISIERKQQVLLQVKLDGYEWSEETEINSLHHGILRLVDGENRILTLHFEHNVINGFTHQIIVYSKYWIYNCSEFSISYYTATNKDNPQLAAGQAKSQPRDLLSYDISWFTERPPVMPYLYSYPLIEKKFSSNLKPSSSGVNLLEIDDDDSNQYTVLQIEDSKLSKPISFAVVQEGEIKLTDKSNTRSFLLGVNVQVAPNPKFRRTKAITIVPRYLLVNKTRHKLYYQQVDFDKRFTLEINQVVPFHWPKKRGTKQLSFSVDLGNKWTWSGGLSLTEAGEFYLKLVKIQKNQEYFIKVEIKPDGKGSIRVTFMPKSKEIYPYRIVNLTNQTLCFWQAQNESVSHTIPPSESIHYAWDSYVKPRFIYLRVGSVEFKRKVSLDKFKSRTNGFVKAEVVPDGPTKVLKIEDTKMNMNSNSESELKSLTKKYNQAVVCHLQVWVTHNTKETKLIFHLELKGIGFSIISETPRPQELIYFHLEQLKISYENSLITKSLMVSVDYFQVDNQLYYTPYPVMLHPLAVSSRKQSNIHAFQMSLIQSNEYQTFNYYHYCSVLFQEMYLAIDAVLVDELLRWIYRAIGVWFPEEDMEKKILQGASNIPMDDVPELVQQETRHPQILINSGKSAEDVTADISTQATSPTNTTNEAATKMVYFEMLHINPLKLNVSFYSDDTDLQMTDSPLRQLLGAAVGKIPNIENAPLKLNALLIEHPFATPEQLVDRITKHYIVQAIKGSYRLLGSVEFLGNPVNIVSSFGTGFKDFFYEPISGIVHGDGEFGKAVSKGAKSLAKKSVYALFSGSSKITSEISNALTHVTMDRAYQAKRKQQYLSRPQTVAEGFIEGAKDLSHGFFDGFAGVVTQPVKGAREEGAKGFFKGVGRGLLGMPIKPLNGIIDFSTKVMQGVSSAVKDDQVSRFRLPRHFSNGLLVPYDAEQAYRKFAMALIKRGKYANENCLFHLIILPHLYLVTDNKVLCVKESKHSHHFNLVWKVRYEEIALVFKSTTNHNVVLRKVKTTNLRSKAKDESNVQYIAPHHSIKEEVAIPTTEEAISETLFNTIQQAWAAWHKENTQTLKKDTKVSLKSRISSFKVSLEKRKDRILSNSRKNSFGSDQEDAVRERAMSITTPDSTDTETDSDRTTKRDNNNNNNDDVSTQQSDIAPVSRSKRSESLTSKRTASLARPILRKLRNEQ